MVHNSDIGPYAVVPLHIAERLSPSGLQVFVHLAGRWANRDTDEAFPGAPLIAETIGVSTRTVRRALAELEDERVIERTPRYREDGGQASSLIRLLFARQPAKNADARGKGGGADTHGAHALDIHDTHNHKKKEPEEKVNQKVQSLNAKQGAITNRTSDPNENHSAAAEVFDHWILTMQPQRRPKFSADRRRKIQARLNEGYGVTDLKEAIDGCAASDFHMGRDHNNDLRSGGRLFNSVGLIFRNAENVDRFAGMAPSLLRPSVKSILETRSVMTEDEKAEAVAANEFPFDEYSNEALARQEIEIA
jgi:hypothetical protein